MTPETYKSILAEYDALISHAMALSHRLTGRPIGERNLSYVDTIFTKLICHGISLRRLCPTLDAIRNDELWDLPSACAVGRSLIEAYDALAYIGSSQLSPSEREFRILLWDAHDQERRLTMLEKIGSTDSRVNEIRQKAAALSEQIKSHNCYVNGSKNLQARVTRGESFRLTQRELNVVNGVDHDFYVAATMFLSQYVHTFPFSIHQLMESRAGEPETIRLASMPLRYAMPFVVKAIDCMIAIWPDAQGTLTDDLDRLMRQWRHVAKHGVKDTDQ